MKFANIRELKLETNKVLKMTEHGEPVVILRKGKPVAVVSNVSEKDFSVNVRDLRGRVKRPAETAALNVMEGARGEK